MPATSDHERSEGTSSSQGPSHAGTPSPTTATPGTWPVRGTMRPARSTASPVPGRLAGSAYVPAPPPTPSTAARPWRRADAWFASAGTCSAQAATATSSPALRRCSTSVDNDSTVLRGSSGSRALTASHAWSASSCGTTTSHPSLVRVSARRTAAASAAAVPIMNPVALIAPPGFRSAPPSTQPDAPR
jgi:hypothetical protein